MFGVDKGDQERLHNGGFARKGHFQKWYKRSFLSVMDCMMLNSHHAWNMSVVECPHLNRTHLKRHEFYNWIADDLLNTPIPVVVDRNRGVVEESFREEDGTQATKKARKCQLVEAQGAGGRCVVCKTDANFCHEEKTAGTRKAVYHCITCGVNVHEHLLSTKRKIHDLFPESMSCHDIIRSSVGQEIWGGESKRPKRSHPVLIELRRIHGPPKKRKRKALSVTV